MYIRDESNRYFMCFYMQMKDPKPKVEARFQAKAAPETLWPQSEYFNGFSFPKIALITDAAPDQLQTNFSWGLLPSWAKDIEFRKNTLNARLETLTEKPSFKDILHQRCLIPANAYFDWQWLDPQGKAKQRYRIHATEELFAFAGLYHCWQHPETGETLNTFTLLTTEANATMAYIHSTKKRMPVIVHREDEQRWLQHAIEPKALAFPYDVPLLAFPD